MRFGVYLYPPGANGGPKDLARLAKGAESLHFDSIWLGDHIAWPARFDPTPHRDVGGAAPSPVVVDTNVFEPLTTLAFLAGIVERISLGVGVLIAPYRNPVLSAKMLAMLDVLSDGRLIVGVGAGWMREEFEMLDAPVYAGRGRVTDEYLQSFVELWTQDEPRVEGKYVRISDVRLNPKPIQKPHPPIWVGGNGVAAMRRAASYGQGWMPLHQTPDQMVAKVRQLHRLVADVGRNPEEVGVAVGCRFHLGHGSDTRSGDGTTLIGTEAALIDQLGRYQEAGVDAVYLMPEGYSSVEGMLTGWGQFAQTCQPGFRCSSSRGPQCHRGAAAEVVPVSGDRCVDA